jgi:DNA-binding MarR family transcriptional regulator
MEPARTEIARSFDDERGFWRAFSRVHTGVLQQLNGELAPATGLSALSFEALYDLSEAPEQRLQARQISTRLGISRAGTTKLIDRLERDGYVEREASTNDRRTIFATLTPEGARVVEKARDLYAHILHHALMRYWSTEGLVVYTLAEHSAPGDGSRAASYRVRFEPH